jgi:hypothetical protein
VGEDGNDLGPIQASCEPFAPFFPSNSPYVLSVGSTFLTPNALKMCDRAITSPATIPLTCDQVCCLQVFVCFRFGVRLWLRMLPRLVSALCRFVTVSIGQPVGGSPTSLPRNPGRLMPSSHTSVRVVSRTALPTATVL